LLKNDAVPYLRTEDSEIFYTDTGPGTGPPIVLVHGWTADSVDWSWLIPALTQDFRVIAYDQRGAGRSAPASSYDLARQRADLAALITRVAGGPAVVVGHSLGGAIASTMAVEHPELTLGVVVLDAPYAADPARRPVIEAMKERLTTEEPVPAIRSYLGATWFPDTSPDWLATLVFRRIETLSAATLHDMFWGMWDDRDIAFRPGTDGYLARRECPVLVIQRDADAAAYEESTFRHPASRAVVMTGCGHWLQIERAPEVAAEIRAWWSTARPAR
jgi:pimeloyl-ACP methyl ester carboxylesterase